jgi:hypothetical protein
MLDYVAQLTKDATRLGPADVDGLRRVGFDDRAILQITLIASWFNYINRVADALGVGREPRSSDPLFTDDAVSDTPGPTDVAERHDHYLYGDPAG